MKIIWAVLVAVLCICGVIIFKEYANSWKAQNIAQGPPKVIAPKIRIGYEYWPGFLPIVLAERLGYFSDEGLDVESVGYDSFDNLVKDTESGVLTARCGFASEVVEFAQKNGALAQIVLLTDYSVGGDGLVARKDAPSIRLVSRPKIALVGNMDFFLVWMLRALGVDTNSVVTVNFESEEKSLEAFKKNEIDYLYTYDPYMADAIASGGVLEYSSKDAVGVVTDVVSFKKTYIEKYPFAINAFVRAYFKAYEFWEKNPAEAYRVVGKVFNMTEQEFNEQFKGIQMLSAADNRSAMDINSGIRSIFGNVRMVNLFTSEMQKSSLLTNPDLLVFPDAVRAITTK